VDIAVDANEPGRELRADLVDIRDPAGFEQAYERYRLPVYRYLRARVVHDEDALDLTATTFERAFAKRASFHPRDGGLGAWLFRIARNAAIDAQRRRTWGDVHSAPPALMDHLASAGNRDVEARREVVDAVAALTSATWCGCVMRVG
jgi:RNA polymerase sigma-70 factor (ECF subfamily)